MNVSIKYVNRIKCKTRYIMMSKNSINFFFCRANYIYYSFLKQGVAFPQIIHCISDGAVKEGVLTSQYIGMLGTGRLKTEMDSRKIVILHTYSSNVPIKLFTIKSNLENPLFYHLFQTFNYLANRK